MMADKSFPWFQSVHTIKVYHIRNVKDEGLLKEFYTRFTGLRTLKGITEAEFDPLEEFIQ